ncbi:hypothetical protein D9M68_550810 [compost metagenome]
MASWQMLKPTKAPKTPNKVAMPNFIAGLKLPNKIIRYKKMNVPRKKIALNHIAPFA